MLARLGEIVVKSKVARDNAQRSRTYPGWSKTEKIALVIDSSLNITKSVVDKYLEKLQKHVEVFYIEPESKTATYADWECFAKKDGSLLKLPKGARLESLQNRRFDLVIHVCGEHPAYSYAVSAALNAPLKCSSNPQFEHSDLIISNRQSSLTAYLDDVVNYLKMIKS